MQIVLEDLNLTDEVDIYFYTLDSSGNYLQMHGAFNNRNIKSDKLKSNFVKGSEIFIEFNFLKSSVPFSFNIHRLFHAFKTVYNGVGTSLSCHQDVNCAEHNHWCNQIRSVCKIYYNYYVRVYKNRVNGEYLRTIEFASSGTGYLINNDDHNFVPYIMTARHVITHPTVALEKNDGSLELNWAHTLLNTKADFDNMQFYFNFQNRECEKGFSNEGSNCQSLSTKYDIAFRNTGCELVDHSKKCDLALLRLHYGPDPQYNVYYAGYDRRAMKWLDKFVTGIHHPAGDLKKISSGRRKNTTNISPWVPIEWIDGMVEGGSSGSPIFDNTTKRAFGALSNGPQNDECDSKKNYQYGKLRCFWGKVKVNLAPLDEDRDYWDGIDPLGACQTYIELNNQVLPSSIYRLAKPEIKIQASDHIEVANNNFTNIVNLCISQDTYNSDYELLAGNSVHIDGTYGFKINRGARVNMSIGECQQFQNCEENYHPKFAVNYERSNSPLTLHPNPAHDIVHLSGIDAEQVDRVVCLDALGRMIHQWEGYAEPLDVSMLQSGMYLIQVRYQDGRVSESHKLGIAR